MAHLTEKARAAAMLRPDLRRPAARSVVDFPAGGDSEKKEWPRLE
jgi:hypothetical protein